MPEGVGYGKGVPKSKQAQAKIARVMGEHKRGQLKSSSGQKVTSKRQAVAIALSEGRRAQSNKKTPFDK